MLAQLMRLKRFFHHGQTILSKLELGVKVALLSVLNRLGVRLPTTIPVNCCGSTHRLNIETIYDLAVVEEVFLCGDYDWDFLPSPAVIVDLGANIGVASTYLKLRYPEAGIFAFEPNPIVASRLIKNVDKLPLVTPCTVAVYNDAKYTEFFVGTTRHASSSAIQRESHSVKLLVPCWGLEEVVKLVGGKVDLLKFDIEGAEIEVFRQCESLRDIREVVGEFHEDLTGESLSTFLELFKEFEVVAKRKVSHGRFVVHLRNRAASDQ